MTTTHQLIEAPASIPGAATYQHLACVDAYDAVLTCGYAFADHVQLRKADGTADAPKSVAFPWPPGLPDANWPSASETTERQLQVGSGQASGIRPSAALLPKSR